MSLTDLIRALTHTHTHTHTDRYNATRQKNRWEFLFLMLLLLCSLFSPLEASSVSLSFNTKANYWCASVCFSCQNTKLQRKLNLIFLSIKWEHFSVQHQLSEYIICTALLQHLVKKKIQTKKLVTSREKNQNIIILRYFVWRYCIDS